jgi:hypothetical protein
MIFRKRPAFHNRYMLFSALVMMMAGSDRSFEVLGIPGGISVRHWVPTVFCLIVILHDWLQLRKIHPGTVFGATIYATEVFVLMFARPIMTLFST